jgi:UDP-glucuronate decarboxylase
MIRKKVLVTGGPDLSVLTCATGCWLNGNEVVCLDNYLQGRNRIVVHLLSNPYFELIRHDVTMALLHRGDEIYNMACPASPNHYQYNCHQTIKTSVMGAINKLDWLSGYGQNSAGFHQ